MSVLHINQLIRLWLLTLLVLVTVSPLHAQAPEFSGVDPERLAACQEGAWSTEIDFRLMQVPFTTVKVVPAEGGFSIQPEEEELFYVSDGDLISVTEPMACAINAELLAGQYEGEIVPFDLGLDAVHIVDFDTGLIAFSTELDDPLGGFSAGDLLFTNGGRIPNRALLFGLPWDQELQITPYDLGLDAVHLIGEPSVLAELATVAQAGDFEKDPERLRDWLEGNDADIWFSIEGTILIPDVLPEEFAVLDGDVLSVREGSMPILTIDVLSPPVGHTTEFRSKDGGYDSGLDALSGLPQEDQALFSTEVQDDGDLLIQQLGSIAPTFRPHIDLILPVFQSDDPVGLDALWYPDV